MDETANERAYWAQGYDRGYAVGYRTAIKDVDAKENSWMAGFILGFGAAAIGFVAGSWILPIFLVGV